MSKEVVSVHLSKGILNLSFDMFEGDVNVDDLTQIHYHNIFGEVVTISVLLNRVGLIRADAEEIFNLKKLELEIFEAELGKRLRRESVENGGKIKIIEYDGDKKKSEVLIKATEDSIKSAIILDPGYQIYKKNMIKAQRDLAYTDSLYWAVQSKDKKLNNLMKEVRPEEFEEKILEESVNGILIKKHSYKHIKNS